MTDEMPVGNDVNEKTDESELLLNNLLFIRKYLTEEMFEALLKEVDKKVKPRETVNWSDSFGTERFQSLVTVFNI